ncbi:MAG: ABC transporter substrate-binding protein, partial [Limisphaerales bacterium]
IRIEDLPILNEATKTNDHQVLDLGPGAEPRLLWFNQNTNAPGVAPHKKAWFREVAFRRAISLAIDRESIMRDGGGGWARGFIVAESPRWLADDTVAFPHKPAQAVNLLGQIGIKEVADGQLEDSRGNKVAFSLKLARGSATSTAVAEAIAQQLNSLGMQVTVEHVEFPALLHSIDTKSDYDAILMGFGGGLPDPHTAGDILRSDGPMHFWNPQQKNPATAWEKRIDDLFLRQRGELEFEQRKKTANEIRVILARELPFIPLFKRPQHAALRARLGNLKASATAPFPLTWNVEELFLQ